MTEFQKQHYVKKKRCKVPSFLLTTGKRFTGRPKSREKLSEVRKVKVKETILFEEKRARVQENR